MLLLVAVDAGEFGGRGSHGDLGSGWFLVRGGMGRGGTSAYFWGREGARGAVVGKPSRRGEGIVGEDAVGVEGGSSESVGW